MLQGRACILRQINQSDFKPLLALINDPELVRYNAPFQPVHECNHQKWLEAVMIDSSKRVFAIVHQDQTIGMIQLIDIHPIHRNAEMTIRIATAFQEKGIGVEAIKLIFDYASNDLGLVRVWLRVFENNQRAISAYQKAGFIEEGTMRKAAFINNQFVDIKIMARVI